MLIETINGVQQYALMSSGRQAASYFGISLTNDSACDWSHPNRWFHFAFYDLGFEFPLILKNPKNTIPGKIAYSFQSRVMVSKYDHGGDRSTKPESL